MAGARALCCLQQQHWPSLLCHGASSSAQSGIHPQRGAGWALLKSCCLFNSTPSPGKFASQGRHLPLSPTWLEAVPHVPCPPPSATVCPVPALDGVPVRDQLLEGLLALQDDGKLLLWERGARGSCRGLGMWEGEVGWESGAGRAVRATSLSLLSGCRTSCSRAISNSARILASELCMQQPISRAFLFGEQR